MIILNDVPTIDFTMTKKSRLLFLLFVALFQGAMGQTTADSASINKVFSSLEEALQKPEDVFRLNLSNQKLVVSDSVWLKFPNLQYLSLKNDHLKQIPAGIGNLTNLRVLDLSGNDFKVLPSSFIGLVNLQELYLNDEKNFQLEKNIPVLSSLPSLKSLHLENDGLKSLPSNIFQLSHLEALYLNNNKFKKVPEQIKGIKSLQYVDIHENKLKLVPAGPGDNFGIRIRF
jgi:Leucine-rich repeat (LRR) protein